MIEGANQGSAFPGLPSHTGVGHEASPHQGRPTTKIEELKQQILNLSREELAELRNWFWQHDSSVWDSQIEADAVSVRLDALRRRSRELVEGKV